VNDTTQKEQYNLVLDTDRKCNRPSGLCVSHVLTEPVFKL